MEITVVAGDVTQLQVQALIVNLFEGVKQPGGATGAVDRALEGTISQLIADGEVKGKRGELTLLHTLGKVAPHRVLVAGLGKQEEFTQDTVRSVTGEACRRLRRLGLHRVATIAHGAGIAGLDTEGVGQAIAEGSLLGLYRFNRHITRDEEDQNELQELQIVEREKGKLPALQQGVERGRILAEATALARDMVNEPSNIMTPARMAEVAAEVAQGLPLELEVLERERMEELGMGALLGVSRGSTQPPKFIVLRYLGDPDNPSNSLGLVGKGITFDSGGISLKPASGMEEMKGDMAGGASVIGAMKALATLGPKLNVTGLVPAVENMPGGSAQRPGDIVRTMMGKTVEVINTDAEGRLILADALCYARHLGLSHLVDMATLTGAMVVALGDLCTGIFGNRQELVDRVLQAGQASGERMWQMPLIEEYREKMKSDVADIKNVGGREAGAITAARFLAEFVEETPWAHLDIAGTFFTDKEKGYWVKGATGVPVRTLVHLALGLASST